MVSVMRLRESSPDILGDSQSGKAEDKNQTEEFICGESERFSKPDRDLAR